MHQLYRTGGVIQEWVYAANEHLFLKWAFLVYGKVQ